MSPSDQRLSPSFRSSPKSSSSTSRTSFVRAAADSSTSSPDRSTRRYSLAFAAKVAVDKYLDHLPLERQARIMKRHGLAATSQTLWKQLDVIARELQPIYDALLAHILAQPVIGLDQTSWKRLSGNKRTPFQMWCLTSPDAVLHTIEEDKSTHTFFDVVGDFRGTVVCDALSTHKAAARASPNITLAACWAHVFRKCAEASPDHPQAHRAMAWIGALYDFDTEAGDDIDALARARDPQSRAIIAEMHAWLRDLEVLTSTSFGAAARYAFANWTNLTRFPDDPQIPLDNNATERGLRGPVVGRENHYGSKSRRGTVEDGRDLTVETAKLNGVSPADYLICAIRSVRLGELELPFA